PGTVSAASFDVRLTANPSGQSTNMTLADNTTSASINLTQSATLTRGGSVYANAVVNNNSNAGGTFNTVITVGAPSKANVGDGTLADHLTISAKNVATVAECATTTGYAALTAAGLTTAAVPKAAGTVLCFQVSLNSSAPSSVKGKAVNISLPITARQLCGVPSGCA
ncbi:MAG: hypothetical protein JWQ75_2919, partial [Pseudarthrobacter sp.]|nr:hypothetical protein [Pseudarthrobacter sp.]